jgi:hypothetical protein
MALRVGKQFPRLCVQQVSRFFEEIIAEKVMKITRQVLMGAAAAVICVNGARAADLPLAEPVEYVKVCNTYGEGFFYVPGTQTCLQLSGLVRADVNYVKVPDRSTDGFFFSQRVDLNFDVRSETEYGTLRTYVRLRGEFANNQPTGLFGTSSGSEMFAEQAFVQFAGFTAGLATSFFDFYASANVLSFIAGSDQSTQLAAYTATFGNGFSATLSAEDRSYREQGLDIAGYGGMEMPDIVANLRVEQAWGAAQLSGAVHQLRPLSSVPDTEYGFAVQAGVMFNLPMLAEGDTLYLQAAYAAGALGYLGSNDVLGIGVVDGSVNLAGDIVRSEGFSLAAELLHYWTPALRSVLAASYVDVDTPLAALPAGFGDFTDYRVAADMIWSPVKNLDLGLEIAYENTDYNGAPDEDSFQFLGRVERQF